MKLQEIMVKEVIQAAPQETVGVAAKRMRDRGVGCLVVTVDGAVKGIITDRDLLDCLAQQHDPNRCQISAHMRRPVIVLGPEEDEATAAAVLRQKRIKRLPIAKNGRLLGMISLSDLAALANDAADRLRPSLRLFTDVLCAQSSQCHPPAGSNPERQLASPPVESTENNYRSDLLDAGGPG